MEGAMQLQTGSVFFAWKARTQRSCRQAVQRRVSWPPVPCPALRPALTRAAGSRSGPEPNGRSSSHECWDMSKAPCSFRLAPIGSRRIAAMSTDRCAEMQGWSTAERSGKVRIVCGDCRQATASYWGGACKMIARSQTVPIVWWPPNQLASNPRAAGDSLSKMKMGHPTGWHGLHRAESMLKTNSRATARRGTRMASSWLTAVIICCW